MSHLKIKVQEVKETLQDRFGSFQDFVDYCDAKVHDKLVELLGEGQGDTCFREITQPELTYKDKRGHKLVYKNDNPIHLNVLQEWWKHNFDVDALDGCCDSLADGYAKDPKPNRIVTPRRGKDVTDKWKLQRESKMSERTTHIIGTDDFITWLYEGDVAARDDIESYSEDDFHPEYMDEAVKNILPKLFAMYEKDMSVEELSEVLQEEYYKG